MQKFHRFLEIVLKSQRLRLKIVKHLKCPFKFYSINVKCGQILVDLPIYLYDSLSDKAFLDFSQKFNANWIKNGIFH